MPSETPRVMQLLVDTITSTQTAGQLEEAFERTIRDLHLPAAATDALLRGGASRLLVYRKLVHDRIRRVIEQFLPRTAARLGQERLEHDLQAFLGAGAATSPYFRDVPRQFVTWAATRWAQSPEIPAYLIDLANHELLQHDVPNDPAGGEAQTGLPLALDRPLCFDGTTRLMRYAFAVHELSSDPSDRTEPEQRLTRMLVYRDAEGDVRYLELSPFGAEVVAALMERGLSVAQGLHEASALSGRELDDEALAVAARLLGDLSERGVMLGAQPLAK